MNCVKIVIDCGGNLSGTCYVTISKGNGCAMTRHIANFYLLGMLLVLMITLWTGARGASIGEVFSLALLAWPASFFVLVARDRVSRILVSQKE